MERKNISKDEIVEDKIVIDNSYEIEIIIKY
jgi:hypothetical protein